MCESVKKRLKWRKPLFFKEFIGKEGFPNRCVYCYKIRDFS